VKKQKKISETYGSAIASAFDYLLAKYPEVFVIGQGLWSPWYVGNSMTDLDKKFGIDRIIDTPVSESACTGAAIGASLAGMKPIIVHPRMDFMLYAMDAIINQAAKWSHMTGGQASPAVTIRAIINRGGEQGAQHSQALHSFFAHVPGLRVVMPSSVQDARDLLVASVLCSDPVIYIDDRWLYEETQDLPPIVELNLRNEGPSSKIKGKDLTIVACGYATKQAMDAAIFMKDLRISAEVIDLRIISPLNPALIIESVKQTGRLLVIDGAWKTCGIAGEIIASVSEQVAPYVFKTSPVRIVLPDAPAPSSSYLEDIYYISTKKIIVTATEMMKN
jgi:pyruvate/2-oxoglutarate/acetoin dehydrogenase E1 component